MLTRTMFCIALAGSLGCLRAAEPVEPTELVEMVPRDERAAELEQRLAEARQQLALRNASLEQAAVMQASLDRRIEELTELNDEVIARLRTAAESAQLAAEHACFTPVVEASEASEPSSSEVALSEAPTGAAPISRDEALVDDGGELLSSPRRPTTELAVTLDSD